VEIKRWCNVYHQIDKNQENTRRTTSVKKKNEEKTGGFLFVS
jgi:hypothetical protein